MKRVQANATQAAVAGRWARRGWAALVGTLAALLAQPAAAQLSQRGGPISYSADNLEYFDDARRLVLIGEVEVAQDDATLRASRLVLTFASEGSADGIEAGDIERIEAEGDVFYLLPAQTARGDRAIYETATDTVTFFGKVVVANDENVIRGETLELEIGTGRTRIKPGDKPGERVRGVFSGRGGGEPREDGAERPASP